MTSSVNNKEALSGYKDGKALPPSTPVSPADASQKWTVAQKSDSSENQASISTEDKAVAAYSSICSTTPILSPISQKAAPLGAPLRDDARPLASSEDKISQFFLKCFSYCENQLEAHQGLWASQDLQKEYLKILRPYETAVTTSKTARLFFSYALSGYHHYISMQCQRFG